jgi:hypothetical protein
MLGIQWEQVRKATSAFIGSLVTAVVTVGVAKHGEAFTMYDWFTVLALVLGVGTTTAVTWKVKNEPKTGGQNNN